MFSSKGFSSNFGSFTLITSAGFERGCVWVEVVSLTGEFSEIFVSKL